MPAFVTAALITAGVGAGVAYASGAAAWAAFSFWTAFATSAVIGGLGKALAKKPAIGGPQSAEPVFAARDRNLSVRQAIAPWRWIVGEARAGGVVTFAELSADKRYFHTVITFAAHECAAVTDVQIEDELIAPDMRDASGNVTSGRYAKRVSTPRVHTATLPAAQTITTSYDIASLEAVTYLGYIGESGGFAQQGQIRLTEVTGTPEDYRFQFSRSGNTLTFGAGLEGYSITINYTQVTTEPLLRIQTNLGGDAYGTQPFPDLVAESAGKWTAAHRQDGHAKMYLRFNVDALSGSIPSSSVVVRGLKTYDVRSGATAWSPTPSLIITHYLCDDEIGRGADYADEIDSTSDTAAANECEERVRLNDPTTTFTASASLDVITVAEGSRTPPTGMGVRVSTSGALPSGLSAGVTYYAIRYSLRRVQLASSFANACAGTAINITDAGSGTHTLTYYDEQRYSANGTFAANERPSAVLESLTGTMGGGRLVQVSDAWHVYAGGYEAPTETLTVSELAEGDFTIHPIPGSADTCNGVRGVFVDPDKSWQPTDVPAVTSATYLAQDGGQRIWTDLDLTRFVNSVTQAQRLFKIEMRRRRYGLKFDGYFQASAYRCATARTFAMDFAKYGWSGKAFELAEQGFEIVDGKNGPAIRVRFSAIETSADIWDWSASEDASADPVPAPGLPDPASISPPGSPSVTEEIYATTGSSGVKSRAIVTCGAPADSLVSGYELRYKRAEAPGYTVLPRQTTPAWIVEDLAAGQYLWGARTVNVFERTSDWVTTVQELHGLADPPSDPTGFAVQAYTGQAKFTWSRPSANTDLDVLIGGRAFVRWSPLTSGAAWENGSLVNPDGYPGDTTIGFGPLMTGTYMLKFRDSTGNYSSAAASFVVTEALLTGLSTLATLTESTAFTGTKTNVALIDGGLQLIGSTNWDDLPGNMDDWGYVDYVGGIASTGSYAFAAKMDLGSAKNVRLFGNITSLGFDTGDTWDDRTDNIDLWGLVDGDAIEDAEATLMVRITLDDPASGGATWGEWHALGLVGDYYCRGVQARLDFTSGTVTHNRKVTALTLTAKQ